ncbi:MAG: hypothetical protein MZV63_54980 [Marinilabiliales bacterium]|nr:hypothetical protein [Marinilabiliales bacterium]
MLSMAISTSWPNSSPAPSCYSDSTLDITAEVVAGLNAKYNAEKVKK